MLRLTTLKRAATARGRQVPKRVVRENNSNERKGLHVCVAVCVAVLVFIAWLILAGDDGAGSASGPEHSLE